jgi:hypothetical protein
MNLLKDKIQAYIDDIQATHIEKFQDKAAEVEMFRVKYLGKKGIISELFEQFKIVPNEEKKELGKALNMLKVAAMDKVEEFKSFVEEHQEQDKTSDLTMPTDFSEMGSRHVLSVVMNEIAQQVNGLLGGVKMLRFLWEIDARLRVANTLILECTACVLVHEIGRTTSSYLVRLALVELRIVSHRVGAIDRRTCAEYADVLVVTQRLIVRFQTARAVFLLPYPIVSVPVEIAHPYHGAEWLGTEQHDCPVRLDDALVLLP